MNVWTWDEYGGEWELCEDLPVTSQSTPQEINVAYSEYIGEDPEEWEIYDVVDVDGIKAIKLKAGGNYDGTAYIVVAPVFDEEEAHEILEAAFPGYQNN